MFPRSPTGSTSNLGKKAPAAIERSKINQNCTCLHSQNNKIGIFLPLFLQRLSQNRTPKNPIFFASIAHIRPIIREQ
jgi:hypothetical protein